MKLGNGNLKLRTGTPGLGLSAKKGSALMLGMACLLSAGSVRAQAAADSLVTQLGGRLEVLWDMDRIASLDNARLTLHSPKLREVAIVHDAPWEGNVSCYHTVFKDGDLYRMYYRGASYGVGVAHPEFTCYAESDDGVVWRKPNLGLIEFRGSTSNNIILSGYGTHNFAPFRDGNPACPADQRYKALGGIEKGLVPFVSPDGIRWRKLQNAPVITKGAFDSQNIAFWDAEKNVYVDYHRHGIKGVRAIMTCTSKDFISWTEPQWLSYGEETPEEHLYTNAIQPYPRAPWIYIGFPKRFIPSRTTAYDKSGGGGVPGLSDGVFMSSRDGKFFKRWGEAFLRPGLQTERWVNRNNMTAWGLVETEPEFPGTPREYSLYSTENYYSLESASRLRRMTVRQDGFVSVRADRAGGTVTTKPLVFAMPKERRECPDTLQTVRVTKDPALTGASSLRVAALPVVFTLPGTANLGPRVTFAVTVDRMEKGSRRLFSSYSGGSNEAGKRKFLLDLWVGEPPQGRSAVRFWYDGLEVLVPPGALPDWNRNSMRRMHVAATYDDGVAIVYVNGKECGRGGKAGKGALRLAVGDARFGEDWGATTDEPFLGVAEDITAIARVLSAEEIAAASREGMAKVIKAGADTGVFLDMEGDSGIWLRNKVAGSAETVRIPGHPQAWADVMLLLNLSTSAAGQIRCEIRDGKGKAIPGYTLAECDALFADGIEVPVSWKGKPDLTALAGRVISLHFELKDGDLYAYRFGQPAPPAVKPVRSIAKVDAVNVGSRRELFVDDAMIGKMSGELRLALHRPQPREIVFTTDKPWEGNVSAYQSVFKAEGKYRMYYRGTHMNVGKGYPARGSKNLCYAESTDGIHWTRPELGLCAFKGSKQNNIILDQSSPAVKAVRGDPAHSSAFYDTNPACPPDQRYKITLASFDREPRALFLLVSGDGVNFRLLSEKPCLTEGPFDTQCTIFWDPAIKMYRAYYRKCKNGLRDNMTSSSADILNFPPGKQVERIHGKDFELYTNQMQLYYRAPHMILGFPMRYYDRRKGAWEWPVMQALPGWENRKGRYVDGSGENARHAIAVTDSVLVASRDGETARIWEEAFMRPGPRTKESWVYGDNFIFWGMLELPSVLEDAPNEISFYSTEAYWEERGTKVRRSTLRLDGFVSAQAAYAGGELVTKPLIFAGDTLSVNLETSGVGELKVELQNPDGTPLPGFGLDDCFPIFGDHIEFPVSWKEKGTDVGALAGKPVRIRFTLKDGDLYAYRFGQPEK